jgi:hypothetical protein
MSTCPLLETTQENVFFCFFLRLSADRFQLIIATSPSVRTLFLLNSRPISTFPFSPAFSVPMSRIVWFHVSHWFHTRSCFSLFLIRIDMHWTMRATLFLSRFLCTTFKTFVFQFFAGRASPWIQILRSWHMVVSTNTPSQHLHTTGNSRRYHTMDLSEYLLTLLRW